METALRNVVFYVTLLTLQASGATSPVSKFQLETKASDAFRGWFVRIVTEQLRQGPSPRWAQRDCAGLVRFAAMGALQSHDASWLRANGVSNRYLPPEINLPAEARRALTRWKQVGKNGSGPFASALTLIQENSHLVSKDINQAITGDLLFFDQGEDQHLMVWLGDSVAYHNGSVHPHDNGLRQVQVAQLMHWKDTRWQPTIDNPNFIGVYRFSFLSP